MWTEGIERSSVLWLVGRGQEAAVAGRRSVQLRHERPGQQQSGGDENLQVPEDENNDISFIMSQFTGVDAAGTVPVDHQPLSGTQSDSHTWVTPLIPSCDQPGFPWDLHANHSASSLDLLDGRPRDDDGFFEGSADSFYSEKVPTLSFDTTGGTQLGVVAYQLPAMTAPTAAVHASVAESTVSRELGGGHEKESVKQDVEGRRADSGVEGSDKGDDDEELKEGRSAVRQSCKNLFAERRRRKKLNDRLYALRSLVPRISKMDKASILGDALEFVKDLQKQVKTLQQQLEETTPEDDETEKGNADSNSNLQCPEQQGKLCPETENSDSLKGTGSSSSLTKTTNTSKRKRISPPKEEKGNQMEPQVEVSQVGANKFFLKVFCEHKRGGFVRLMEAVTSLGLDVVNVNVTTSKPVVLNVFEVEKRDSEVVQAEQVRSSLLRLTLNSDDGEWPADSSTAAVENDGPADYHAHHRQEATMHARQHNAPQHPHRLHGLHHHRP